MSKKPVILTIIDGLGLRKETNGNAFALANTPNFDDYFKNYPNAILEASGEFVGLPEGQMGNSEVGHLTIGAGKIIYTGLSLINYQIKNNLFEKNKVFLDVIEEVKSNNTTLHIMGLLSTGGVHSHEDQLFALLELCHKSNLKNVVVHVFGDGRDVAPRCIKTSLIKLNNIIKKYNYNIGTISGRFYAMDRDQIFERNMLTYDAMVNSKGNKFNDIIDYVDEQYKQNISDEFIVPAYNENKKNTQIKNNDSIIFFNFRPDRARQLSHLFINNSTLYDFKLKDKIKIANFVSFMKYEGLDTLVAFKEDEIEEPIGKVIEKAGLSQLRIAETQKYAHVTFFMDGGVDIIYKNEDRILVDSIKADSFADYPNMSAKEITDALLDNLEKYDLIIMNYANPDMVGHTGNLKATIKAVEFLDKQLGRIKEKINSTNVTQFITADHGNAEITEDENNKPATKHTTSPVMLICSNKNIKLKLHGSLSDVAPTIIDYMNLEKPNSMTGESLILKNN